MNCGFPLLGVKWDWPLIMDFTEPGWGEMQGLGLRGPCNHRKGFPGDGWEGLSFIPAGEGSSEQAEVGSAGVSIPVPEPDTSPRPPWASNNNPGAGWALLLLDAGVGPERSARKAIS